MHPFETLAFDLVATAAPSTTTVVFDFIIDMTSSLLYPNLSTSNLTIRLEVIVRFPCLLKIS